MNPTQAWAILNARSPPFPRMPRGFGGLQKEDVAAMLAGLEREPYLMGLAYELMDRKALQELEIILCRVVETMARENRWRQPRERFICRRMASLALFEALDPLLCLTCNGRGAVEFSLDDHPEWVLSPYYASLNEHEGKVRCLTCLGSGKLKMSNRKRADLIGVHKFSWSQYWSAKYEPVYQLTKAWLGQARRHLKERMDENQAA